MNYIKQLQKTVEEQKREIAALREMVTHIKVYLDSSKYSQDPYVNKSDIILRLNEGLSAANCANDD